MYFLVVFPTLYRDYGWEQGCTQEREYTKISAASSAAVPRYGRCGKRVIIKPSPTCKGIGVFAQEDIEEGDVVEVCAGNADLQITNR